MKGFAEPNYTQTPNALFDNLMKDMGEAELRVTLAVIRKTMGFHKDRDAISWTQIMEMTGLSRTSTQSGIDAAIEHGFIKIVGKGKRGVNVFSLVVEAYQSTNTTSTSSVALPVTSSVTLPTKETAKENKQKKDSDEVAIYIKAWLDGQSTKPVANQYKNKTNREIAKAFHENAIPTERVTAYVKILASDPYWKGKLVPMNYVGNNIAAWLALQPITPPPVAAAPLPAEPAPALTDEQAAARIAEYNRLMAEMNAAIVEKAVA